MVPEAIRQGQRVPLLQNAVLSGKPFLCVSTLASLVPAKLSLDEPTTSAQNILHVHLPTRDPLLP